jgi:hypothetical protein
MNLVTLTIDLDTHAIVPRVPTEKQTDYGVMAMLGSTESELENLSPTMFGRVSDEFIRAYKAACLAAPQYKSEQLKFDDYPEFNHVAMGCGLEDAGHIDRYDAMRYGWYQAIEMLGERIDNFLAAPKGEKP